MSFTETLIEVVNSNMIYTLLIVASIITIILGAFIIIGIKTTGRVILIDQIFKKKDFKRQDLNRKYIIQGVYTIVFGLILLIVLIVIPYNGVILFPFLIAFVIADFLYDLIAIKTSTKQKEKQDEEAS